MNLRLTALFQKLHAGFELAGDGIELSQIGFNGQKPRVDFVELFINAFETAIHFGPQLVETILLICFEVAYVVFVEQDAGEDGNQSDRERGEFLHGKPPGKNKTTPAPLANPYFFTSFFAASTTCDGQMPSFS